MTDADKEQELQEIKTKLKQHLVDQLSLDDLTADDIADDAELFGEGLGLDSLDAVEIVVILQRNFGVEVKTAHQSREVFQSINTLAQYIVAQSQG